MPAKKAPSASDRPKCSVSHARPSVTSSRFNTNSSSLLRRATIVSHQRITFWPPTSSTPSSSVAFSVAQASELAMSTPSEFSAGISTSKGTTARSWNSSAPITRRPCSLSSSSRSAIIFTTMAVLDIAIAPPSTSEPRHDSSQGRPLNENSHVNRKCPATDPAIVSSTCAKPSPNTSLRMLLSFGRLNSSPITNIRNTTPNSAR